MRKNYIDQYGIDSLPNLRQASEMGCEYFMTINYDLLADRKELEEHFKIKIRTPEEYMEEHKDDNND